MPPASSLSRKGLRSIAEQPCPSPRTGSARGSFGVRWRRCFGQLLFPQGCCLCEGSLEDPLLSPVCPGCVDRLRPLTAPACPKCGLFFAPSAAPGRCGECRVRKRPFRMAVAAAPYEGVFQRALVELKFRRREVLAELLSGPAVTAFRHASRDPEAGGEAMPPVAVLPVPLPFWRSRRRGVQPVGTARQADRPGARDSAGAEGAAPAGSTSANPGHPERPPPQCPGGFSGKAASGTTGWPAAPAR